MDRLEEIGANCIQFHVIIIALGRMKKHGKVEGKLFVLEFEELNFWELFYENEHNLVYEWKSDVFGVNVRFSWNFLNKWLWFYTEILLFMKHTFGFIFYNIFNVAPTSFSVTFTKQIQLFFWYRLFIYLCFKHEISNNIFLIDWKKYSKQIFVYSTKYLSNK